MKKKLLSVLGIVLIFVLFNSFSPSVASSHTVTEVSNDDMTVQLDVTNLPKFSLWEIGENDSKFTVQFIEIFEAIDTNQNHIFDTDTDNIVPDSQQVLSSWSWSITDIVEDNHGEMQFNLTADTTTASELGNFNLTIVNHLSHENTALSFEVIVDNYNFVSSSSDAIFVLGFDLVSPDEEELKDKDDRIEFDDGYLGIEETAASDTDDINVGISALTNETHHAFISYENFESSLHHLAVIGIDTQGFFPFLPIPTVTIFTSLILMASIRYYRKSR